MTYVKADKVPEFKTSRNDLQSLIREFMNDDSVTVAKLNWKEGEYASPTNCYKTMYIAVIRSGRRLKVRKRGDEVYLEKYTI